MVVVDVGENPQAQLTHMEEAHKDVCELHKSNPNEAVGFRIEFLQVEQGEGTEVSEVTEMSELGEISEMSEVTLLGADHADYTKPNVIKEKKERKKQMRESDTRRRSWVWKYFDKLSSIIFKCNICNVVLSIKGCNTNNMNRHVKSRHPALYHTEIENSMKKKVIQEPMTDVGCEVEIPEGHNESIVVRQETIDRNQSRSRTSWVWNYFVPLSKTHAQCKVCRRTINHGGNATGNMNRHLKKLHDTVYPMPLDNNKELGDPQWIWKLFTVDDPKFYDCRLCGFKCQKFDDIQRSVKIIVEHLRLQHEVVSGDQIVTATECEQELEECNVAVDFLKDSEEI